MLELWSLLFISMMFGRRIIKLLPNIIERTIGFYITPILGLSALVLAATLYGWVAPFNWIYSLPITAGLLVLAMIFDKRKLEIFENGVYLFIFAFICSLPVMAPIIRFGGYNPFTDIFTYLAQAQWLQDNTFGNKVITSGNYPALTQIALYQETGSRMGGTFLLAYIQSLFNLRWSYYAYTAAVSLGLVCGSLALGGIIRHVIPSKRITILALAILPSLMMNGFIYGAEWGFYPQTLGLAFALGICAIFPYLSKIFVKQQVGFLQVFKSTLPLSIVTAALLFAYNEPFPIFAAAIGLFILVFGCLHLKNLKTFGIFIVAYIIETIILINYEAIRIFINIYQTLTISSGSADIGWPVLWSPIQFLAFAFGMQSPFNFKFLSFDYFYSTFFAPIVIVLLVITLGRFLKDKVNRRENIIFLFCIEFVLIIFFLKFRYFSVDKSLIEVGHTFLQFKIAKYAAPFSIALLGVLAAIWWHYLVKYRKLFTYIYVALFIVGLWFHCGISAKNLTNHFLYSVNQRHNPFGELLKLRESVKNIPNNEIIYVDLGESQSKLRQMVAYILYDRKIASDYRDDGYILGRLPVKDANMSKKSACKILTMKPNNYKEDKANIVIGPFILVPNVDQ